MKVKREGGNLKCRSPVTKVCGGSVRGRAGDITCKANCSLHVALLQRPDKREGESVERQRIGKERLIIRGMHTLTIK